jgi:hypothetical protein
VWRDEHLVATGTARIELICFRDGGPMPIVIDGAVAGIVRAGDVVQRLSDHPAGLTALLPQLEDGAAPGEALKDSDAQQLICFALTVSDYWATKALDRVEQGTTSASVLAALREYVDAVEHPQSLRHRALRTLRRGNGATEKAPPTPIEISWTLLNTAVDTGTPDKDAVVPDSCQMQTSSKARNGPHRTPPAP